MKNRAKHFLRIIGILSFLFILLFVIKTTIPVLQLVRLVETTKDTDTTISGYDIGNSVSTICRPVELKKTENSAVTVQNTNGVFFAEFENTYFGTLKILFPNTTKNNMTLEIVMGEYADDGHVWTRADSNKELMGLGLYYFKTSVEVPAGTNEYTVRVPERPLPDMSLCEFDYVGGVMPFAYCQVSGYTEGILTEDNLIQIGIHADYDDNNSFFISDDTKLNRVYNFCKQSVKATTYAGVYVDGYRELGLYEGDAYINQLSHFSVDNNYDLAKETLRYFSKNHSWPTEYVQETILIAYDYYMYSGDREFIQDIYPDLENCLLESALNDDGLIDSSLLENSDYVKELNLRFGYIQDIIDYPVNYRDDFSLQDNTIWLPSFDACKHGLENWYCSLVASIDGDNYARFFFKEKAIDSFYHWDKVANVNSVVNALYYADLERLSFLAEEIGEKEKSDELQEKADKFKTKYVKSFINPDTGLVLDSARSNHSSLQANMFALEFGLVPEEHKETVTEYIKSRGIRCGLYGVQFLSDSLANNGEEKYVIELLTNDSDTSWIQMMDVTGSKITTEGWNEDGMHKMDWNHAWGTSPVNIIARDIVGIKPREAGCETIEFDPHFGNLNKVSARVPLNGGFIDIEYKNEYGETFITLNSPRKIYYVVPNCVGEYMYIDGSAVKIKDEVVLDAGTHEIRYK